MPIALSDLTAGAPRQVSLLAAGAMLVRPSVPSFSAWSTFSARACLALALYHEARGEIDSGQVAVARVILNRSRSRAYPPSICGVVYQNSFKRNRCQFSFACDGRPDIPADLSSWKRSMRIAAGMLCTKTCGALLKLPAGATAALRFHQATHYHTIDVSPSWSQKLTPLGRIGDHLFFASERVLRKPR